MRRILLALTIAVSAAPVLGRECPTFYEGVRPLGMGGAFTAVADDGNAVFYNPAGLDKVQKLGAGVINPLVEANKNGIQFYKDARDTDFNDTAEVIQLLEDHMGERLHARVALYPSFWMRHFGVGVLGQASVNAQPGNPAYPEIEVSGVGGVSGHAGLGFGFLDGILKLGAAAKYVRAQRLEQIYTAADIASNGFEDRVRDDLKKGTGFGFDAGAMVEFPVALKPTVAVVVQNIGDVDLEDAGVLPQQVNLGASVMQSFSSWLTLIGAADWVDVTSNVGADDDVYKRLHFGAEVRLWQLLALRAGLYQGYGTLGASLDLWSVKLDYATYAAELGSAAGDRADRRQVVQLTLGW
ncbi:MAG: hypothetical protein HZB55_14890 [Deltaproteobacteria bacterium]|nr:hypothetical protein [Deltaproteobacteria bacterium]